MIEELLEKANAGDKKAQRDILHKLIYYPENELLKGRLKEFADLDWEFARYYYLEELKDNYIHKKAYEIKKMSDEIKELSDKGWEEAKSMYIKGIVYGCYGFEQNPIELKKLFDKGGDRKVAEYYVYGISEGIFGLKKDEVLAAELSESMNIDLDYLFYD